MIRGTTPVLSLEVEGENFEGCRVFVTIDQAGNQVTKDTSTNDVIIEPLYAEDDEEQVERIGSIVEVYLSQDDTLELGVGSASVQIRWIDRNGSAFASDIETVNFERVLLEEVIGWQR